MILKAILKAEIRFYQKHISPLFPPCCRYRPSCSQYGLEAVDRYGAVRGAWLATLRILRCNPFAKGGWDPVPRSFDLLGRHKIEERDPLFSAKNRALRRGILLADRTQYHGFPKK
ncbi:MAG: membrane protein insertion efficiency factor YidD [Oscillospiraceae bacterium]|nr:membrane protein insertion efficiency factor YidD [Oscillospiraceae bacterium]